MVSAARDLVIVMAGDSSLHVEYAENRSFDLWVIYYGDDDEVAARYAATADRLWRRKGMKVHLARTVLVEELWFGERFDFRQYRRILLPDDDIRFEGGTAGLEKVFADAEAVNAEVFQPAIANEYYSIDWEPTLKEAGAFCRRTNLVEIMMPGYRGELFVPSFLSAIHALEYMTSGWGLEVIVMKLGEAHLGRGLRTFVLDEAAAVHTRPIGSNPAIHAAGWDEAFLIPQLHTNRMRTLAVYASAAEARADTAPDAEALSRPNPDKMKPLMQRVRVARQAKPKKPPRWLRKLRAARERAAV